MQLVSFECVDLHGYISREIEFFSDINFLHGINGSGKTSTLQAIQSLLTPDVMWLTETDFSYLSVIFQHDHYRHVIDCRKDEKVIQFRFRQGNDPFKSAKYPLDFFEYLFNRNESEIKHQPTDIGIINETQHNFPKEHNVFGEIRKLPTPLYLGLDRTSKLRKSPPRPSTLLSPKPRKRPRKTSDAGTEEAWQLLNDHLSDCRARREKLISSFRDRLITSVFTTQSKSDSTPLEPSNNTLAEFDALENSIRLGLETIGFTESEIGKSVSPLFQNIRRLATPLIGKSISDYPPNSDEYEDLLIKFVEWYRFSDRISLIQYISYSIDEYYADEISIYSSLFRYLHIMNSFFEESGKKFELQESDRVIIRLPGGDREYASSLSSGEKQIFALITHLMFNPRSDKASLLIIDEPELSLHIDWQEQFVDSIISANTDVQLVLATHSPSIINEKVNNCIQL